MLLLRLKKRLNPIQMNKTYKLFNKIKHYEWGSDKMLPDFLGIENDKNVPYAEMWMGTHPGGPSQIEINGIISNLENISGELPFLFKLLAAGKPLSIQAHPNKEQASAGFKRENDAGLSQTSPLRNYKDQNDKPEIICVLTEFTLMAGFRDTECILKNFEELINEAPVLKDIILPLLNHLKKGSLFDFFKMINNFSEIEKELFSAFFTDKKTEKPEGFISNEQWQLINDFAVQYPKDTSILAPLYLNLVKLQPGQAIFIPAGILHSYIKGFAIELMSNSDNVLRGGLTHKNADIKELINILHFVPFFPQIITPCACADQFSYHTMYNNFLLTSMNVKGGEKEFPEKGPAICIVTEGEFKIDEEPYKKGDSFFIPQGTDKLLLKGDFSLFAASCGE